MRRSIPTGAQARSGHTLVEISITFALFIALLGVFSSSLSTSFEQENLQRDTTEAHKRLDDATEGVRRRLELTVWSGGYPMIVDASTLVTNHPAIAAALGGTATNATASNALVYLEPTDVDSDEWPDQCVDGNLEMATNPSAFVLVEGTDGVQSLVHVDASGRAERVARGLVNARFDDATTSSFTIPLDGILFRASVDRGAEDRPTAGAKALTAEVLVRLER